MFLPSWTYLCLIKTLQKVLTKRNFESNNKAGETLRFGWLCVVEGGNYYRSDHKTYFGSEDERQGNRAANSTEVPRWKVWKCGYYSCLKELDND
jgi:hypothetical protein